MRADLVQTLLRDDWLQTFLNDLKRDALKLKADRNLKADYSLKPRVAFLEEFLGLVKTLSLDDRQAATELIFADHALLGACNALLGHAANYVKEHCLLKSVLEVLDSVVVLRYEAIRAFFKIFTTEIETFGSENLVFEAENASNEQNQRFLGDEGVSNDNSLRLNVKRFSKKRKYQIY